MKRPSVTMKQTFAFRVLYYWGKLIGINPLNLSSNNQLNFSYFSALYAGIFILAYSYLFYEILMERLKLQISGETPVALIVNFISIITGFLEITSTWFTYNFHQNRVKLIVKSFIKVERTSRKLNTPEDYTTRFRKLGLYLAAVNIAFIIVAVINNAAAKQISNYRWLIWLCYFVPRLTIFNSGTLLLWCLVNVKRKFHKLNEQVHFIALNSRAGMRNPNDVIVEPGAINNCRFNSTLLTDKINIISQLHRELRELIRCLEGHYNLLLLFGIVFILNNMTLQIYIVTRYFKKVAHISSGESNYLYLGIMVYWIVISTLMLTMLSNVCGSTSEVANEAGNIVHAMLNNYENFGGAQNIAKFNAFSLELLRNRVRISVYGLLDLDYFLVYRVLQTVAMYLTIMLQF